MRTMWKYKLELTDEVQDIQVPHKAVLRLVAMQRGEVALWFEVLSGLPKYTRTYIVRGTGHEVPDGAVYVGTCFCSPFVWHVFEMP